MMQSGNYQIGFILEQTLGHRTHTQNLQALVVQDSAVDAQWGLVEWETKGLAARIPIYNSNWTIRAGLRARRQIERLQQQHALDALFIHTQVPAIFAADWVRRIPTVISLDATPWQYDALGAHYAHKQSLPWLERQKWRLNRNCFQSAQHLVTWSEWTKQSLIADYEVTPDKITVIPPGVYVDEWRRPTPRTADAKRVKILFVGGDLQRKGGQIVREAFEVLRWQMGLNNIELHLVTRDPVMPAPGLYVYRDMQPNSAALKQIFFDCDIFCLPTYGDCLPMVLSEAGAAGLPSVSTDVGAITEIVEPGQTGFVTAPGDVKAVVAALRQLIEQPALRLQLGAQAAELVRRRYDAQQNTRQLLTLLKQSADKAKRRVTQPSMPTVEPRQMVL
ncbi:MAG: glycosyltransferase family 4 protein [Caldilineaceae bacterium]